MDKIDKSALICAIIFLSSIAILNGIYQYTHLEKSITFTKTEAEVVILTRHIDYWEDKLILENKLQEIYDIAYLNAQSHEYKFQQYDCTQFSEQLVKELKAKGYRAQCTAGDLWTNDYTNHTWVSVWVNDTRYEIEAINGEFIEPWVFDEGFYTKWKEDYCW